MNYLGTFEYAICCLALTLPALIAIQFVYAPRKHKSRPRNILVTGHGDFAEGLVKALGLGSHIRSIQIVVEAGYAVRVEVEQYLNEEQATKVLVLMEKYRAVELES